ncbi:MAG: DUF6472 family protein [Oscillospiraceae bacterium]
MKSLERCEDCVNFVLDEDAECMVCEAALDEDDMFRFLSGTFFDCPYYRNGDDYKLVAKQL